MQTFFQNGDEQINGDGGPDLSADRVWRGAVKGFDAQMLLDPFEEEFDLPTALIEFGDGQRRHGEVVGQEDQPLARFWIAIADAAHRDGIIVLGVKAGEYHGLVETQAGGFVNGAGVTACAAEVLFGAGDKESAALVDAIPAGEVEVAAIHDVERSGVPDQLVEDVDIMNTACGDNDDRGKVSLESQQGMEFDGGLVLPKRGPGKQRETEVNGSGVQRIGGGLEFKTERLIGVKRGSLPDEHLSKIGKDTPVAIFVGIGQSAAGGGLADAGVVEFGAEGRQAGFDVAQTFAPSQLSKRQHEEVFVSGEFADAAVAVVTGDTLVELVFGEEVEELGENGTTFVHKVENRRNAGSHPQGIVAELKSKNDRTAVLSSFYNGEITVSKN